MAVVRVGVIGLGAIGRRLTERFAESEGFAVRHLCDVDGSLAARTAAELGVSAWSADYREMLQGDRVDLVYLAVPPKWHCRIALDVIAAGRHLLCEKPLALTLAEARAMREAAEGAGIVHAIHFPLRYAPGIPVLQQQLGEGTAGEVRHVAMTMRFPRWPRDWQQNNWVGGREQGGAIREVCPHLFDTVLQLFGPVGRVWASMEYAGDPAASETYTGDSAASETSALGLLELESGLRVSVRLLTGVSRAEEVSLTAYGTRGTLGLVDWASPVAAAGDGPPAPLPVPDLPGPFLVGNLLRALRGEPAVLPTFADGFRVQQVLDAWERSAASGRWERLLP